MSDLPPPVGTSAVTSRPSNSAERVLAWYDRNCLPWRIFDAASRICHATWAIRSSPSLDSSCPDVGVSSTPRRYPSSSSSVGSRVHGGGPGRRGSGAVGGVTPSAVPCSTEVEAASTSERAGDVGGGAELPSPIASSLTPPGAKRRRDREEIPARKAEGRGAGVDGKLSEVGGLRERGASPAGRACS